jgi:hypothetical protein
LRRRHDAHRRSCRPELRNAASQARHPMDRTPVGHAFGNGFSTPSSRRRSRGAAAGRDSLPLRMSYGFETPDATVAFPVEDPAGPVLAPDLLGAFEQAGLSSRGDRRMVRKQRPPAQHDRGGRRRRVDVVARDNRARAACWMSRGIPRTR